MSGLLTPDPRLRELNDLGLIQAGALLHTYVSGSPSTPLATYTTDALSVAHANPIVASAGGLFPAIYLTPGVAYKYVLTDALGNPLWEQDPVLVPAALVTPITVIQGGTGLIVGVSGGIPYFASPTTMGSSALLALHALILGGGAGLSPTSLALGLTGQVLAGVTAGDPIWRAAGVQDTQFPATVVNTAAETTIYTWPVPANLLGTTRALELLMKGDHLINNGGADSIRARVKYGATTIFDAAIASVNNGANRGSVRLRLRMTAFNSAALQKAEGEFLVGDSTQNNAGGVAANLAGLNSYWAYGGGAAAEDSTAIKNLVVTIQLGTANALIDLRPFTVTTELK